MINIQNLTFGYSGSKRNVFSQFNLQMKPGSVYGPKIRNYHPIHD